MRKIIILIIISGILAAIILFYGRGIIYMGSSLNETDSFIALQRLKALPYLSYSSEKTQNNISGVTRYERRKVSPGYNLYTDDAEYAYLMDMSGKIINKWRFPPIKGTWVYFELLDNGEIIALCDAECLVKLDCNSNIIWIKNIPAHHDIEILADGTYLIPAYKSPVVYKFRSVKFDLIAHVDENGQIIEVWDTFKNLKELRNLHPPQFLDFEPRSKINKILILCYLPLRKIFSSAECGGRFSFLTNFFCSINQWVSEKIGLGEIFEYYHLNTIEVLPETDLGKKYKQFQKGNYLVCLRNTSLIIILDKDSKKVVWRWGPGQLDWPHTPTMLKNGDILIFDNGTKRGYSRIVQIDPLSFRVVWQYEATPVEDFFTVDRGSCQRLPNGNTLISESAKGHIFEINQQKEVVWEFYNPQMDSGKRKVIYRMVRVPEEKINKWLKTTSSLP